MKELERMLGSLFSSSLSDLAREAKAAPLEHKLTRVMEPGKSTRYRYWGSLINGKGQSVRFCWSVHRNAAGFFLGWRETVQKNGTVRRDRFLSRRSRLRCREIAHRRYLALQRQQGQG